MASQLSLDFRVETVEPPLDCAPIVIPTRPDPPEYTGKKLDAEGHRWWASYCWAGHAHCVGRGQEDPSRIAEWSDIADIYKGAAIRHEKMAEFLEGARG